MADALVAQTELILKANQLDMEMAKGKISPVMLDRLYLDESRIFQMAEGFVKLQLCQIQSVKF